MSRKTQDVARTALPKPGERIAHPDLVTQCKEPGKGWRRDAYGNMWPCSSEGGPDGDKDE